MQVLVVSRGLIHPSFFCRQGLSRLLQGLGTGFTFHYTGSLQDFKKLSSGNYNAVILYYHQKKIGNNQLAALFDFARQGGGVLALHSAMASCKENSSYQELLGGRFTGHDRIESISVFAKNKEHPIAAGVDEFTVRDELYVHEYDQSNEVIMACKHNGSEEPVLWTKAYGRGRVCYFAPGHCLNVWFNPAVKKVIHNSLLWIGGQEGKKDAKA